MFKYIAITMVLCVVGISLLLSPLQAKPNGVLYQDQVAVLMYHHVHDADQSSSTITTKLFKNQLQYLTDKGYQFITLSEFRQYLAGASVPNNAVLVTFDDGYQSFYTNAYPVLKSLRVPAVNFIITGDLAAPLSTYIPSMSKEQISDMTHSTNFIDAQCHTDALHNKLTDGNAALVGRINESGKKETDEEYRQRILQDTSACRAKLSQLYSEPIDSYAYPFGISNAIASKLIHEAGIQYAFTITPEMATRNVDPLSIPRINAGSPFIRPELLDQTIRRRIVAQDNAVITVDADTVLEQLGGTVSTNGKNIDIHYQGKQWSAVLNQQKITGTDRSLHLREPLRLEHQHIRMLLTDLELVLGVPLVYHPITKQISVRMTPTILK